jgi:hypothetical protein
MFGSWVESLPGAGGWKFDGGVAQGILRNANALASPAAAAARDTRVEQVIICTPDKNLAQCVQSTRILQLNRRKRVLIDEAGAIKKKTTA